MKILCPNRNLSEWKSLVDEIGEPRAYLSFFRNQNQIPTPEVARQKLGMAEPKPVAPPKVLTPAEALSQHKSVKVSVPSGANQIRITTSDGKRAIETLRNLNSGANPFQGVENITKVEAGVTGVSGENRGKFVPVKGDVTVNPTTSVSTTGESNEIPSLSPYMEADAGALAARASEFIRKVAGAEPGTNVLFRNWPNAGTRGGAAFDAIEKAFGRKILFMDFGPAARGINGFIIPDIPSVIFLNTNAQNAPLVVVGHELFEHLKISSPELYEQIISEIGPMIVGLDQWHDMLSRAYAAKTKLKAPDIAHSQKELVANFIGDSFADPEFWKRVQANNPSLFEKVGRIVLDWLRSLLNKLRGFGSYRFFNDIQAAHDVIARGLEKFSETPASGGVTQESTASVAVEPEGVEVQIGGKRVIVPGTEKLTREEQFAGQSAATKILQDLKIPGRPSQDNVYTVEPDGFNYDAEGRSLIAKLTDLIGKQNIKGADAAVVPMLVRAINYNLDAWGQVFSPAIADELRGISAGESSMAGQRLRMMQGQNTDDISAIARNVNFYLKRTYSQMFGGEAYESFLGRVLSEFGRSFTDSELAEIAASHPKQEEVINKILAEANADQGGRVYRKVQQLLKPKSARKLSKMEADAKVAEAAQKIIEDAAKQGIVPPQKKGTPLSPLQKLLLMVTPENVEKLNALISQAVKDAEHNAGVRAALNAAPDRDAREELEARFYAGEEPTPEQIEEGLNLQEFSHWRVIRDNILGYSPVTTSLAEQMIKSDFKGAFFKKAGQPKPQDLRINLFQLAKNPDAEVQRVTDNYINALQAAMNLSQSTPEIKQQVAELVRKKISDEIKARRQEFLDNFFTVRNSIPSTAVDKLKQLINAGVSKDPRFQSDRVRQLVKKMAAQYLKDTDFNSLATSTRAEKFNWLEQKYDEIYKAEHFDQLDEKTREYFEAVVRTQLAERIQAGEESVVRSFLTGADVNFVKTPVTSESRASSLNAAKSKLEGIIRAGAFDASMVDVLARKGPVQRLLPTISGIAKAIVQTPSFRLESAKRSVIDNLVNDLGIDPANADKVWAAFMEAYALRFEQARQKAVDAAIKSMTPEEKRVIPRDDERLWKVVERFFRAGGDDVGELLKKVAVIRGLTVPTPEETDELKRLVDRIDRLQEITPVERARIMADTSLTPQEKDDTIQQRNAEEARINRSEIVQVSKKLLTKWAVFTRPFSLNPFKVLPPFAWIKPSEAGKNTAAATVEMATSFLLAKIGFPVRLFLHTQFQYLTLLLTRPPTLAWEQIYEASKAGKPLDVWQTVTKAYMGAIGTLRDAWEPGIRQLKAQMAGRGDLRTMDRLLSGTNALERAHLAAQEYAAKGDYSRAAMYGFLSMFRYALRVVGALDAFQGEEVEFQEFRTQFYLQMAKAGKSRAEAEAAWSEAFGDMKAEWARALIDVGRSFQERGKTATKTEMREAADYLVKQRMYQKLKLMNLPADDTQSYILRQKLAQAWQSPPAEGSLGAMITRIMSSARRFAVERALPFLPMYFGQAIGNGINYHGRLLPYPLNKLFTGTVDKEGHGSHATNETEFDRKHNIMMSLFGTLVGATVVYLMIERRLKANLHYPTDKKERDKFIAEGHKVGTIEWVHDDGTFTPHSMTVGPFSLIAPYVASTAAAIDLTDNRAKQQKRADDYAIAHGLQPTPIPHDWVADILGVSGQAAWNTLLGGSTAAGLVSSYSEFGVPNAKKSVAAAISPLIPLAPTYQEISRMMGVALDKNEATVFDYIIPLPTSQARMVNVLGDPVKTPDDIQRVIQAITAGSYPFSVNPKEAEQEGDSATTTAYQALFSSGFMPPAINPQQGHNINGVYRPFNSSELEQYSVLRGQYLKENLAQIGASATPEQAKEAYQDASRRALSAVGVQSPTQTLATAPTARSTQRRGYGTRIGRTRRSLRVSTGRRRGFGGIRVAAGRSALRMRKPRTRSLRVRAPRLASRLRKLRLRSL